MAVAVLWEALGNDVLKTIVWSSQGVTFTLQTYGINEENDYFSVLIRAVEFGTGIPLPLGPVGDLPHANPFYFQNPLTAETTAENLLLVKQMVEDAVLGAARKRGWTG